MAQPGMAHPETFTDLTFSGSSGTECENFIRFVKRKAFSEQKSRDNEWMAFFASTCFTGAALRWFESLDEDTQYNWKLLSKALLAKYPATYGEDSTPKNANSSSSGGNTPSPPAQNTPQYAAQSPVTSYIGGGSVPGSWLPAAPPPPPPKGADPPFNNMTIPAAPPPRANVTPTNQGFNGSQSQPPMPRAASATASLVNSFRKLNLTGKHRGRIAVRCDLSPEDGYISRKITKESSGLLFGFHVVTKSVINALQIEFTQPPTKPPNSKPHIFKLLNSSAKGFEFLGITWFERQPNYLGKGPGHTAYSHMAAVKGKESWELESSYQNNDDGSYGDHDSDFNIVGKEIWRVSQSDGSVSAWWSDYGGQLHELEFAVCLHDKELYFVSDYGEFAKLYGPSSYTKAKLVFEPL